MLAVLQGETTGGIVAAAGKTSKETVTVLGSVARFFTSILDYLTSTVFIANVVATVIVIVLAIVLYRVTIRLVPRILSWRRPRDETLDARALVRIKRQDTAVTLIRNTLRYVTFTIVTLFIISIFLRNVLPTVAGASLLAAIIGFGAQNFLRDII